VRDDRRLLHFQLLLREIEIDLALLALNLADNRLLRRFRLT